MRNPELYDAYKKPVIQTSPAILPPADNFQAVDDMINQIGTATDKSTLKNNGKIHEHAKAEECENLAENLNGTTISAKIIDGGNIPNTNLN